MTARVFYLVRLEDETGVSGTGIVAEGVLWSGGDVSVRWLGETPCVNYWPGGIEHVRRVHGHHGKTKVVWADGDDGVPPRTPSYNGARKLVDRVEEALAEARRNRSPDAASATEAGDRTQAGPPALGGPERGGEGT